MISTNDPYHFPDTLEGGKPYFQIQIPDAAIHHLFPGAEADDFQPPTAQQSAGKFFPQRKRMKYFITRIKRGA